MDSRFELKWLTKAFERLSKRLRFLETLPRPSSTVVDTFLELTDTPDVYTGYGGFAVFVNPTEDGLRFDPVGGACVAFTCGPVGWRGTGGTIPRTLVHEAAFQLSAEGNDRGAYAIDLQQERFSDVDVAAAEHSAILSGKRSSIDPDASYCVIIGGWNNIYDTLGGPAPSNCSILGDSNEIESDGYALSILGQSHYAEYSNYGSYFGYNQNAESAFGCFSFIEGNDIVANVNDNPTYSGSIGILNLIEGDVFDSYQFGESNKMIGLGTGGNDDIWMCLQIGYENRLEEQGDNVWQFGRRTGSYLPAGLAGDFFNGRMVVSGDSPNQYPAGAEFSGFNQNSWFNQNTSISTWNVAWTSSRFQFPIIQDSVWFFEIFIAGTEIGCANSYAWKIEGLVENDGGTTTILVSTVTNVYRDVVTKEWQVTVDDPNDRLVLQYRDTAGPDATICNIQFSMHTVEVGYD